MAISRRHEIMNRNFEADLEVRRVKVHTQRLMQRQTTAAKGAKHISNQVLADENSKKNKVLLQIAQVSVGPAGRLGLPGGSIATHCTPLLFLKSPPT